MICCMLLPQAHVGKALMFLTQVKLREKSENDEIVIEENECVLLTLTWRLLAYTHSRYMC